MHGYGAAGGAYKRGRSAGRSGPSATKNAAQEGDGKAQFSLKTVNGKQVVWIENNALTNKQLSDHRAVADYIAQHIGEVYTIIESGQKVYIGKDLPGEYTQSKYTSYLRQRNRQLLKAKNKAVSDLGMMIETSTNRRWEKTEHTQNKDAKYGMYRYDSAFAFPVRNADGTVASIRVYDMNLLVRNASDGKKYLYDIVNIKENTTDALDLQQRETRKGSYKATAHGSAFYNSKTQKEDNVKYSLKDSSGRTLTEKQREYFKDSEVRDKDGSLKVVYHGSGAKFTKFIYDYMSKHGSSEGQGFYFTDKKDMAQGYEKKGGQLLKGYLNISKPLSDSKITMKRTELTKLLKAVDPTGDDVVINYDPEGGMRSRTRSRSISSRI